MGTMASFAGPLLPPSLDENTSRYKYLVKVHLIVYNIVVHTVKVISYSYNQGNSQ